MVNNIEFYQLTSYFYAEHKHLVEIIDKGLDGKLVDKGRGYGVLLIKVKGYKFAIPLRSKMHINHKDNFTTKIHGPNGKKVRHGLDYSKAVIITDMRFVSVTPFLLHNKSDFLSIRKAEHIIIPAFEKYISRYVKAVQKPDKNILKRYKYSTLQNYHHELGLITQQSNS
jgi:protein AbiQ